MKNTCLINKSLLNLQSHKNLSTLNEEEKKELKAFIEEEKKILEFYSRYREDIEKITSNKEWEIEVNECLERLSDLYGLLEN